MMPRSIIDQLVINQSLLMSTQEGLDYLIGAMIENERLCWISQEIEKWQATNICLNGGDWIV